LEGSIAWYSLGSYGLAPDVLSALAIVRPETVIRWCRVGFAYIGDGNRGPRGGRPKVPALQGFHGELFELGIEGPVCGLDDLIPTALRI
jgi:hypothetical protein